MTRRILLVVALACLLAQSALAGDNPWLERRVLNMAHRGGRAEAPEHTMYAYRTALPKGVDVLEVDVWRTTDGVLVVHHDSTVNRVTNGSGRVDAMTLAELKALDNAYAYAPVCGGTCGGRPAEDYVFRGMATGDVDPPEGFAASDFQFLTFEEVLTAFPDVLMSVEIKGGPPGSLTTAEDTADLLRTFGRATDVLVASFDPATIDAFKIRAPEIHTTPPEAEISDWLFFNVPLSTHAALQIPRVFQDIVLAAPGLVNRAHADGLAVYVFIDPPEETAEIYNELIDSGMDGVITDNPSDLRAVLEERDVVYAPEPAGGAAVALLALATLRHLGTRRSRFTRPRSSQAAAFRSCSS